MQRDMDIDDIRMPAATAQQSNCASGGVVQRHDLYHRIGKQVRYACLPWSAAPCLCHDARGDCERESVLHRPTEQCADSAISSLECQ